MKKLAVFALGIVGLVLAAGLVAAAGPYGTGAGTQAAPADRPMDGRNTQSPWLTDDADRLAAFQEAHDLTDAEMERIQTAVDEAIAAGATPAEIRDVVAAELGVDPADLGPATPAHLNGPRYADGARGDGEGPRGPHGDRDQARDRDGSGDGDGPHGPGQGQGQGAGNGPGTGECRA